MKKIQLLFSQETLTYKQVSKPRLYYLEPPVWKEAQLTPPTQVQGRISGVALNYFSLTSFIESALCPSLKAIPGLQVCHRFVLRARCFLSADRPLMLLPNAFSRFSTHLLHGFV